MAGETATFKFYLQMGHYFFEKRKGGFIGGGKAFRLMSLT
jgi:hypothetical protein